MQVYTFIRHYFVFIIFEYISCNNFKITCSLILIPQHLSYCLFIFMCLAKSHLKLEILRQYEIIFFIQSTFHSRRLNNLVIKFNSLKQHFLQKLRESCDCPYFFSYWDKQMRLEWGLNFTPEGTAMHHGPYFCHLNSFVTLVIGSNVTSLALRLCFVCLIDIIKIN